jgi:hypothetical protein
MDQLYEFLQGARLKILDPYYRLYDFGGVAYLVNNHFKLAELLVQFLIELHLFPEEL